MARSIVDAFPKNLSSWRMINSGPAGGSEPYTTGTEFAGRDAPKLKFLFTLSFELGEALQSGDPNREYVSSGSDNMAQNTYDCKSATRPNVNINYTEVSAYNYRFKVPTKTNMGTVTVVFYDDNNNTAHKLLQNYLAAISPITNKTREQYYATDNIQEWASMGGMINEDINGLIRSMRVTHHYNKNYRMGDNSHAMIHYDYMNPQLQDFNWEELDMSTSDAAMITATFVYDSVNITIVDGNELTPSVHVGEIEQV